MPDAHDTVATAPADLPRVERRTRPRDDSGSAHVLVVDDNEMNRDLLARRLQREGHRVDLAVDGRDALDKLAADPFDLVLLDIMMPGMDGHEVLQRL
ncbi:MAG TPA: response regulator, partial [Rhodanobacteraceae bacterium]|nr:response regulator [Rhodanobacteraceae bacterium]